MKKSFKNTSYLILATLAIVGLLAGCSSQTATSTTPPAAVTNPPTTTVPVPAPSQQSNLPDRVDVVYFQRGKPCACIAVIGENIQAVVLKDFMEESTAGKLTYTLLDSSDRANIAIVRKYNTPPFGLFLTLVKGTTEKIVPVEEIWAMTGDEAKYKEYVKNAIAKSLKGEM
jgi:hypothetical protein